MKTFKTVAAQGEITVIRVCDLRRNSALPADCAVLAPENGNYIIGHSETGHHHIVSAAGVAAVGVMDRPPEGMRVLYAIVNSPTPLIHLRDYDTHEPIMFDPGEYRINIGREYDPYESLSRMQAD